jgi:hypothetical protein
MRPVLAALTAALALSAAGTAWACSCIRQNSAAEHLAGTELAFTGRVLGTRVAADGSAVTRFQVRETLKGRAPARTLAVSHHAVSATCGLTYKRGATVLVLADRRGSEWRTGLCSAPQFPEADYRRAARATFSTSAAVA